MMDNTPEALLFQEAKRMYRSGLFTIAIDAFESLRVNYPLSPYVEFAELKIADGHFEMRDYALAATSYEEFVKSHPASTSLPYVLLRAGQTNRLLNRGVGRDPSPLKKAKDLFTRLLKEYPDSIYAADGQNALAETNRSLAAHDQFVIDFYRHHSNEKAVAARAKLYEDRYRNLEEESRLAAAPPQSIVRTAALENPKVVSVARSEMGTAARAMASPRTIEEAKVQTAARNAEEVLSLGLQRVQCREDKIFLYLKEPIADQQFLSSTKVLRPRAGKVDLALPNSSAQPNVLNCFGKQDLSISAQGALSLKTERAFDVMTLNNPPRLLLIQR
jgi:outer membrane protein assembly factor BamD